MKTFKKTVLVLVTVVILVGFSSSLVAAGSFNDDMSSLGDTVTLESGETVPLGSVPTFSVQPNNKMINGKIRITYNGQTYLAVAKEKVHIPIAYDAQGKIINTVGFEGIGDPGYTFLTWHSKSNHKYNSNVNGYRERTINAGKNYRPYAKFQVGYTLSITAEPNSGGTVLVSPDKESYAAGEQVALTAVPTNTKDAEYMFVDWTGDASGTSVTTVTMDADRTVTANFRPKVSPVFEFAVDNGDGTYTAHFGFNVHGSEDVTLPKGDSNKMTGGGRTGEDQGQLTSFSAGRQYDAFQVDFDGSNLVWTLDGSTATASHHISMLRLTVDPEDIVGGEMTVTNVNNGDIYDFDGKAFSGGEPVIYVPCQTDGSDTQLKFEGKADTDYVFDDWGAFPGQPNPRFITYDMAWRGTSAVIQRPQPLFARAQFSVTFVDEDGSPLDAQTVANGGGAVLPAEPSKIGHAFAGWDLLGDDDNRADSLDVVKENIVATATYATYPYTVTFVDFDGSVLGTDIASWNTAATPPTDPTREGHTFDEWDSDFSAVKANMTVAATYSVNTFMVTFVDNDGSVLGEYNVDWNQGAAAPAAPSREGHTFTGWDSDFSAVTQDITVTAVYRANSYVVTFVGEDGTILDRQTVDWNRGADAPSAPNIDGLSFAGWDSDFDAVMRDITVSARYEAIMVDVLALISGSGTIDGDLEGAYAYGTEIDLADIGVTPTDGFTFSGWQDAQGNDVRQITLTQDTLITAVFSPVTTVLVPEDIPESDTGEAQVSVQENVPSDDTSETQTIAQEDVPVARANAANAMWWLLAIVPLAVFMWIIAAWRQKIIPVAEMIHDNGDGTYTITWGYENKYDNEMSIMPGKSVLTALRGSIKGGDGGAPQAFGKGRVQNAFTTIVSRGSKIEWKVHRRRARVDLNTKNNK